MVVKKFSNNDFQQIIEHLASRRKRIKYTFQELGFMLAEKLNDMQHKSLYFRLAKYENRELLMKAYMAVVDASTPNKGRLFMWKLKQLKQSLFYRSFIGLYIDSPSSLIRTIAKTEAKDCLDRLKKQNMLLDSNWWHITMAFWSKLPATSYMTVSRLVDKFNKEFLGGNVFLTTFKSLGYAEYSNNSYIFISGFDRNVYSLYQNLKGLFLGYKGQNKNVVQKAFHSTRFYPHITVARLKKHQSLYKECHVDLDIQIYVKPFFTISRLTTSGPDYKIHTID